MLRNDFLLKVDCPIYVTLERKTKEDKKVYINLNTYRNLNRFTENHCKRAFALAVKPQLENIIFDDKIVVEYKVFKQSARRLDKMNVVSITSKYLLDSLVEFGVIVDDNDEIVMHEIILPSEIDRVNPRVEVSFYKF